MCTAGVALRGLRFHADLRPGERVLITGATGGVGIHAIQLAKRVFGAHVVALTSSEAKAAVLREYGADEVIVCSTKEQLQQFHHRYTWAPRRPQSW
jgi:NADPH:quinone reductase-like Zn-dependent oxidoreductase